LSLNQRVHEKKVRMTIDYLFGKGLGSTLSKQKLRFEFSKRTKRIRYLFQNDKLFATFRPDGTLALTREGARTLAKHKNFKKNCVVIDDDVKDFIKEGKSVFAKHVVSAGELIRPNSEVAVLNSKGEVIAVGRAVLPASLMTTMKRGVAVKVRRRQGE
jgi:uncharacterized protein with predicted RNA binding PUA domain